MEDQFVQSDPKIMMGKPGIVGTRITVESILERLGAGESTDEIVAAHPQLTKKAVMAVVTSGPNRKKSIRESRGMLKDIDTTIVREQDRL